MIRKKSFEILLYDSPYNKLWVHLVERLGKNIRKKVDTQEYYEVWDRIMDGVDGVQDERLVSAEHHVNNMTECIIWEFRNNEM